MKINFFKYQGTGNDFVVIDQREHQPLTRAHEATIAKICDRRFGIGADGLILLQHATDTGGGTKFDFEMIYFNADGRESSMCGNGGRCIVAFAHFLGIFTEKCTFLAIDGAHEAHVFADNWVELKMIAVENVNQDSQDGFLLNTGSPHYVIFSEDISDFNIFELGREVRYSNRFRKEGVNVNFVEEIGENHLEVATYERGVEAETLSCGTGVTAAAIAHFVRHQAKNVASKPQNIAIKTKGGNLSVKFEPTLERGFQDIWLCGPAVQVFDGQIEI